MDTSVSLKAKMAVIIAFIPGSIEDIAMMVPCHVNTLRNIRSGHENVRFGTAKKIDELYKKALKIKAITES